MKRILIVLWLRKNIHAKLQTVKVLIQESVTGIDLRIDLLTA